MIHFTGEFEIGQILYLTTVVKEYSTRMVTRIFVVMVMAFIHRLLGSGIRSYRKCFRIASESSLWILLVLGITHGYNRGTTSPI